MKIAALLILLISMAATFTPCCVFDGCEEEISSTNSKQEEKNDSSACSPFSSCTTCSGAVIISRAIQIEPTVFSKNDHTASELSFDLPSYHPSFWQPPRTF